MSSIVSQAKRIASVFVVFVLNNFNFYSPPLTIYLIILIYSELFILTTVGAFFFLINSDKIEQVTCFTINSCVQQDRSVTGLIHLHQFHVLLGPIVSRVRHIVSFAGAEYVIDNYDDQGKDVFDFFHRTMLRIPFFCLTRYLCNFFNRYKDYINCCMTPSFLSNLHIIPRSIQQVISNQPVKKHSQQHFQKLMNYHHCFHILMCFRNCLGLSPWARVSWYDCCQRRCMHPRNIQFGQSGNVHALSFWYEGGCSVLKSCVCLVLFLFVFFQQSIRMISWRECKCRFPRSDKTGSFCPDTYSSIAVPCPKGTHSTGGASACSVCPAGSICPTAG